MSKPYWNSAGSGALGLSGPWHSSGGRIFGLGAQMRRRLVRTILLSLLIAFLIGAAVGIYRQLWLGDLDSLETATFAYGFAGRLISFPIAWIMDLVALDTAAQWLQDYVLYYLEIPYQLCAFAGACTATAAIGLVDQIIPGLGSHH